MALGVLALGVAAYGTWLYPVQPWLLAAALLAYATLLWARPAAFLVVLPVVLPAIDLGMWTGWMIVDEADLAFLVTLGLLLIRQPLRIRDLPAHPIARLALAALLGSYALAALVGFLNNAGFTEPTSNPVLLHLNALRLFKGIAEALVLVPYIRHRQIWHGDASRLFAWGMSTGLLLVALEVMLERGLFTGLLDFSIDYRVVGPFSTMRFGGGLIGTYLAMALPFVVALPWTAAASALALFAAVSGSYALMVTFARSGYAAGAAGVAVTAGWLGLQAIATLSPRRAIRTLVISALILTGIGFAAWSGKMQDRLATIANDLTIREANWRSGWATADHDLLTTLFGTGLGTFQRAAYARADQSRPGNVSIQAGQDGSFVHMQAFSILYFGQKISPPAGRMHLTLSYRLASAEDRLGVAVCDKLLLYSDQCRGVTMTGAPGQWLRFEDTLSGDGLGAGLLGGLVRRPVELALYNTGHGRAVDFRDVVLTDDSGRVLLVNGTFRHGLDRWVFTDDDHLSWRMKNQYLMSVYETGVFGLGATVFFVAVCAYGAVRDLRRRRDPAGAAVIGAIVAFALSSLFDSLTEAPRLMTLFLLVCAVGLTIWRSPLEHHHHG
jgi:hypothetical protein